MPVQMNIERQPVIQCGSLTIDQQCCMVKLAGEEIALYPKVLSPAQIYMAVWQEDAVSCEHVVYNVICQLRRKLKNPDMIQTVIGRGYKFVG